MRGPSAVWGQAHGPDTHFVTSIRAVDTVWEAPLHSLHSSAHHFTYTTLGRTEEGRVMQGQNKLVEGLLP